MHVLKIITNLGSYLVFWSGLLLPSLVRTQVMIFGHIMICGSGTEVEMLLCGKTCPPLIYSSSFTITSSPRTVVPSILTHRPTTLLQPTMHLFKYSKLFFDINVIHILKFLSMQKKNDLVYRMQQIPIEPCMLLYHSCLKNSAAFNTTSVCQSDTRSDCDIRSDSAVFANHSRWIYQNIAHYTRSGMKLLRMLLPQRSKIHRHSCIK